MRQDLRELVHHTGEDDCPTCQAQSIGQGFLVPAASSWELYHDLPRFSLAINGAAQLLGAMLEDGYSRDDLDDALKILLDDIEQELEEDRIMGGPPRGTA